ncbi:helix-turn-helix transcriptional regulator [Pararhizobium sp. BT-229]|uniref:helix-turn-helix transcriptional regulator n=1 Tax=Pararhizobium sp. BT-229 TaxID=2986923 RepID=UPI0021F6B4C7|nr:helix-turn-helix transcriptional regulator [Pararhizobium sp. BT-229]MCV9962141.1 helix-turn-helix transcriptional regulator [Pararhizobium sp. BT-229]
MRVTAEPLSQALDQIQAAVFEPSLWLSTIDAISRASGALGVNIMEPAGRGTFGATLNTEDLQGLLDGYVRDGWDARDFRARLLPPLHRAGVVLEADFTSREQFDREEYYKFLRKHGVGDCVIMDISSGKDELYFVLQNRKGDDTPSAEDMPHFHVIRNRLLTAMQLARHIEASKIMGMAAAFETSNIACIFFDRKGRVTVTNAKADALLTGDLRISRGEVRAASAAETVRFHRELKIAIQGSGSGTLSAIRLSRPGKRPLIVRFERFGAPLADVLSHSCAMALIEDPDEEMRLKPETLAALFDLTPAEARVSLLVASGLSAVDIASQHGIGYETVRSHIRSIFQKTGTGRQSELSALFGKIRL